MDGSQFARLARTWSELRSRRATTALLGGLLAAPPREEIATPYVPSERVWMDPILAALRVALGAVRFAAAWEQGATLSREGVVTAALAVRAAPGGTRASAAQRAAEAGARGRDPAAHRGGTREPRGGRRALHQPGDRGPAHREHLSQAGYRLAGEAGRLRPAPRPAVGSRVWTRLWPWRM